jgi:ATP-dependent DNA helicase RecG
VPCSVDRKAYLRGYDADFQLSHLEEQAFIAARKLPMFDRAPVEGGSSPTLTRNWWTLIGTASD